MGNTECCGPRRAFYNDRPMSPHTMMDDDKQNLTQHFSEVSPLSLATVSSSHIENPLYASLHSLSAAAAVAEEEQHGRG